MEHVHSVKLGIEKGFENSQMNAHKMIYTRPAGVWQETLLLGNGKMGAMVYGNPDIECIHMNLDTLWSGEPGYETAFTRKITKEMNRSWSVELR